MNENNYIYKPFAIVQDKRLTPSEQDYLCLIAQLEKAKGCTASNSYFAKYFGVSRARAADVITSLRKKCFIESTEKKQGGKTIERTILIVDVDSKKALLRDGKESPAGLIRKTGCDSKESCPHTTENTLNKTTDKYFHQNSDEFRLAEFLCSLILSRKPDFKKPNLQAWAKHIGLMMRLDNRTVEQIEKVISWSQQDGFWQNNILSTAKLREKFDQLQLRMCKQSNPTLRKTEAQLAYEQARREVFGDEQK